MSLGSTAPTGGGPTKQQMRGAALVIVVAAVLLTCYTLSAVARPVFWKVYADWTHTPSTTVALASDAAAGNLQGAGWSGLSCLGCVVVDTTQSASPCV
jgi:hypothetical protein